jgi:hypothetical protein
VTRYGLAAGSGRRRGAAGAVNRSLDEILGLHISVLDFGAVGM